MLRFLIFSSVFLIFSVHSGPISKSVECAVCQFFGVATSGRNGNISRAESIAHCQRFEGCEKELSDCEIVQNLDIGFELERITGKVTKFENVEPMVREAAAKCRKDPKSLVISQDASSTQCMMCFLVYDVLKYINYNILENPMLGTVKNAILAACGLFLNDDLCQALFMPDTFGAIIRGLQDSLGGFYDLIAVQAFGCPAYTDLFGKC